jgi:hypothetical protein
MSATPDRRNRDQVTHDKALGKSEIEARSGNLPILVRQDAVETVWTVHSRTKERTVYHVRLTVYGELSCACPATVWCWHKEHVSRARAGEIGQIIPMTGPVYRSVRTGSGGAGLGKGGAAHS